MEIQERQLEDMSFDELKEYARVLEMVVLGEKEKTTKSEQGVMKTKEEIEEKIERLNQENRQIKSKTGLSSRFLEAKIEALKWALGIAEMENANFQDNNLNQPFVLI